MLQLRSFGKVLLVVVGVINSPAIKEDFPFPTSYSWGTKNHLAFPAGLQIRLQHLQARCLRCTVCSAGCCPLAPLQLAAPSHAPLLHSPASVPARAGL